MLQYRSAHFTTTLEPDVLLALLGEHKLVVRIPD